MGAAYKKFEKRAGSSPQRHFPRNSDIGSTAGQVARIQHYLRLWIRRHKRLAAILRLCFLRIQYCHDPQSFAAVLLFLWLEGHGSVISRAIQHRFGAAEDSFVSQYLLRLFARALQYHRKYYRRFSNSRGSRGRRVLCNLHCFKGKCYFVQIRDWSRHRVIGKYIAI